jgi:c-di-GMP-binding flagellar brake protein YcgR
MPDDPRVVLTDAAARNVGLILSLPSAGMWRHHKSRFLGECDQGVWIESATQDASLIDELIGKQAPAAVSFKNATGKTSFVSSIVQRDPNYRINAQVSSDALLLRWPAAIKSVQRRSDYRVRVTPEFELTTRVWRISEQADIKDEPLSHLQLQVELRDLSIGGMGIFLPASPNGPASPVLAEDARLRIELRHEGDSLILDGRLRHKPKNLAVNPSKPRVGVQFKKLEDDLEGRQSLAALTRIVGLLQREEVRRARLGLAEAG